MTLHGRNSDFPVNIKTSTIIKCNKIAFVALCILLVDCSVSGSGHWLIIGSFSLRIICGLIGLVFSIPSFLINWKKNLKNYSFVSIALFIIILLINAYIGISKNYRVSLIFTDLRGFSWLGAIIIASSVIDSRKRIIILMKCIVFGGILQALLINTAYFLLVFNDESFPKIYNYVSSRGFSSINPISTTIFRISTGSIIYLPITIILLYYFSITEEYKIIPLVFSPILIFSLLISFTRSSYGATFLSVVYLFLALIIFKKNFEVDMRTIIIKFIQIILCSVFYISIVGIIIGDNLVEYALLRSFPSLYTKFFNSLAGTSVSTSVSTSGEYSYIIKTIESDSLRAVTVMELWEAIKVNPIFGNGLGHSIKSRGDGLVEYFYMDLLAKTGIIGLVLFSFPFFNSVYQMSKIKKDTLLKIFLVSGLVVIFSASYFNPYLNTSLGIIYYSFVVAVVQLEYSNVDDIG